TSADGRTLKPITMACDAAARLTSFSVIAPTPVWMTLTRTSGCWILPSSETIASTEPWRPPSRTLFRSWTAPVCSWLHSASAGAEPRLDDRAGGVGGRIGAQVELGVRDEQNALEQVVEVLALLGRDARDLDVSAPLLGLQSFVRELTEHPVGVRVGQVDLV